MKLNYRQICQALQERKEFDGNSMSARYVSREIPDSYSTGIMPVKDREYFKADLHTAALGGVPFYCVSSYNTPIAWAYGNLVRVPDVTYSRTTSRQQTYSRTYLR